MGLNILTQDHKFTGAVYINNLSLSAINSDSLIVNSDSLSANSLKTSFNTGVATNNYSFAEGYNTLASGESSHAEGDSTIASGDQSHASGISTVAYGAGSYTEGYATSATDYYAHAEGDTTIASYYATHAEGGNTKAIYTYAHAEGHDSLASGLVSHAEGEDTVASGNYSHAEGRYTSTGYRVPFNTYTYTTKTFTFTSTTSANFAFLNDPGYENFVLKTLANGSLKFITVSYRDAVDGYIIIQDDVIGVDIAPGSGGWIVDKSGNTAHAEGNSTQAYGNSSHAEGEGTIASGNRAHAEGLSTQATGNQAHAEGDTTISSGRASHAEGRDNTASGASSHAEGRNNIASGESSHVEGKQSNAFGIASHAAGYRAQAKQNYTYVWTDGNLGTATQDVSSTITGQFLVSASGGMFIPGNLGIGTSANDQALTVVGTISTNNNMSSKEWVSTYTTVQGNSGTWGTVPSSYSSISISDNNFSTLQLSAVSVTVNSGTPGSPTTTNYTAGATTWVCPAGVNSVTIEGWGGGGAGAGAQRTGASGVCYGGGGAGGGYAKSVIAVTPGATYYINVGSGGTATNPPVNGTVNSGGDTWFNSVNSSAGAQIIARGGVGAPDVVTASGTVGTAGIALNTNVGNVITYTGGSGSIGVALNGFSGGGGGCAGSTGNGNTPTNGTGLGGTATASNGGPGGNGNFAAGAGNSGPGAAPVSNYGGGGGGARASAAAQIGGNGAPGYMTLTYTVQPLTKTVSNLIPAGSLGYGVVVNVIAKGSATATTFDIYDSTGFYWGKSISTATGTKTNSTNYNLSSIPFYTASPTVTLSSNNTFNNTDFRVTSYFQNVISF